MGFKNKVVGFVAAAALTLSMGAGIASANSLSGGGSAYLHEGFCKITMGQTSAHFGDWTWNGDEYLVTHGSNSAGTTLTLKTPKAKTCVITAGISDLTSNGNIIANGNFIVAASGQGVSGSVNGSQNMITPALNQGNYDLTVTLDDVPENTVPGWYTGTITVTVGPN